MPNSISQAVLDVLKTAEVSGQQLRIPQELDRKLYDQVNKFLDQHGGIWDKQLKAHVFPIGNNPARILASLLGQELEDSEDLQEYCQLSETERG